MDYFKTIFAAKYGDGAVALNGSFFDTLLGKSLGGDTPTPVMPTKGDIIGIDMNGDGTDEAYLVLKTVSDSVVEVLARANIGNSAFASSGNTYENGTLDIALNTTYYATLSETAKEAISDKTFVLDCWYGNLRGNPDYNGTYASGTSYVISLANASFGNEITRHVYAISAQDIIDYLEVTTEMSSADSTLNKSNIQTMCGGTSVKIWTRSAGGSYNAYAIAVSCNDGRVLEDDSPRPCNVLPAFQIDLSKIAWTPSNS